MMASFSVYLVLAALTVSHVGAQCTRDSDCARGQCCADGGCQQLATEGQACPALEFRGRVCGCDSRTTCVFPSSRQPPSFGTCRPKPRLLQKGACSSDDNCEYDQSCTIPPCSPLCPHEQPQIYKRGRGRGRGRSRGRGRGRGGGRGRWRGPRRGNRQAQLPNGRCLKSAIIRPSEGVCTSEDSCSSGQCCVADQAGGTKRCTALSSAGELCPANVLTIEPDRCECDSASECRVPLTGSPPRYGACELKKVILPGGRCFTNRNCNFGSCCVIQISSLGRVQPEGFCMELGMEGQTCTNTDGQNRHEDACPCQPFSLCENVGQGGTGKCGMRFLPPIPAPIG